MVSFCFVGNQARPPLIPANTMTKKTTTVRLLHDIMIPCKSGQVWTFFPFTAQSAVLQDCLHKKKKRYYISRIQVWTQNDGQSSLWSWGVSEASPTFSKKSVIHTVIDFFWLDLESIFIVFYYIQCFSIAQPVVCIPSGSSEITTEL